MANPFKEAEKAKKVAPGGHKETVEKTEDTVNKTEQIEKPAELAPTPVPAIAPAPVVEPVVEEAPTKPMNMIEALIGPAEEVKKQEKKTLAVYLSIENQTWLKKAAAARGKSVSELLDQILTELRG